jgi:DNA modification methylase
MSKSLLKKVKMNEVQPHFLSLRSHKKKDLTNLMITMKFAGKLLEDLKVVDRGGKFHVFDGLSRYFAAAQLGWDEIDIEVMDYTDKEIEDQLVLRNVKSNRSLMEKCDHAEMILGILGKSQGKKRELLGDINLGDDEFGLAGKERFEIAAAVIGNEMSASTLRRTLAVRDFTKDGDHEAKALGLIEKMQKGILKPNQAFSLMKKYQEEREQRKQNPIQEIKDYVKGKRYQLFNKTCEDLSDIPDNSIQLCTTSNTYFQQKDYDDGKLPEGVIPHGEELTVDDYIRKQVAVFWGVRSKLKDTGSLFIITADSYSKTNLMVVQKLITALVADGWYFIDEWIWKKNQKPQTLTKRLQPTYEKILHFVKDPDKYYFEEFKLWKEDEKFGLIPSSNKKKDGSKAWSLKRPIERFRNFLDEQRVARIFETAVFDNAELKDIDPNFSHPAPFPSFIPLLPILMCSKPGETVLDIYSGSGTTAAVALQLGRNAIGYDTDTKSHEFAAKRLKMVEENLPAPKDIDGLQTEYMDHAA